MIGLPSLRDLDDAAKMRVWLASAPIDMRLGFDRLAALATAVTDQDPLGGHLFAFHSRRGDRLKILLFERDARITTLEIDKLRMEVELLRLRKWYYGRKADTLHHSEETAQLVLDFAEQIEARPPAEVDDAEAIADDASVVDLRDVELKTVRTVRRGRRDLAAFDALRVVRRTYDLPEGDKPCPCCGEQRTTIGESTSWQLEYVPGHFERVEHVRLKYACSKCEQNADVPQIVLADKPAQPIDKGLPGPGLLAFVVSSKFYLPLYRIEDMTRAGCWAHARRKFVDAEKSQPQIAKEAVTLIGRLYDVERKAKSLNPADRLALRQEESSPVLARLYERLSAWKLQLLPKHPMSEAVGYAWRQWKELSVFAGDAAVPIDNNVSEREMKRIVIGRKHSLFVGNERGGRTAAVLAGLLSTCRRHEVDPQHYLTQLLTNLPGTPISRLDQWLPDRWKKTNDTPRPTANL